MGFDYQQLISLAAKQQEYQDKHPTDVYLTRQRSRTQLLVNREDNMSGGGDDGKYEKVVAQQKYILPVGQISSPEKNKVIKPDIPVQNNQIPNSSFAQIQGHSRGMQEDTQLAVRLATDPNIPAAGDARDTFFRELMKISLARLNSEAAPHISMNSGATTVVCLRFGKTLYVESLGQCRGYLLNQNGIKQVSITHQSIEGVNPFEAKRYFTQERYTRSLGNEQWTARSPSTSGLIHESESTKYALNGNETLVLATDGAAEPLMSREIHQKCYPNHGHSLTAQQMTQAVINEVNTHVLQDDATIQVSALNTDEVIDAYAIFDGSGPHGQDFSRNASEKLIPILMEVKASLNQREHLQKKWQALAQDNAKKHRAAEALLLLAKIDMTRTADALQLMAALDKFVEDETQLLAFYQAYGLSAISNVDIARAMLIQDLEAFNWTLTKSSLDTLMRTFITRMKTGLAEEKELEPIQHAEIFWGEIKKLHGDYSNVNKFYSAHGLSFRSKEHKMFAAKMFLLLLCCGAILFAPYSLVALGAIAGVVALVAGAVLSEWHYNKMYSPLWHAKQCLLAANNAPRYDSLIQGATSALESENKHRKEYRIPLLT